MSGPLPVPRVPRPSMPEVYDQAQVEFAFQALERDLGSRFSRKSDLALEPGKRLVLAGSGGNTQYALGLDDAGKLTVTNYVTGAAGTLIVDWAAVDGAAARDLQITSLTTQTAANTASVAVNASAITSVQGAAAFYTVEVAATGSDPALVTLRAGASGSEIGLIARIIRLKNIVGSTTVEVMRAVGGLAFFSSPISMDFAARRLTLGPGFGVSGQEVIFWFGPGGTAPSAQSRTNGYFAFGSNGLPYFGTLALSWGATATADAASNALVAAFGFNQVRRSRMNSTAHWEIYFNNTGGTPTIYWFSDSNNEPYIWCNMGHTVSGLKVLQLGSKVSNNNIPVLASTRYEVSAELLFNFSAAGSYSQLQIGWFNASGVLITADIVGSSAVSGSWDRVAAFLTSPPAAASARLLPFIAAFNGHVNPGIGIRRPFVAVARSDQTAFSPYSVGVEADLFADSTATYGVMVDPRYPLSAPAVGQIAIAATTIYRPTDTLSLPSATITGLANDTDYAVFRDTTAGTYVTATGTLATYIADLKRYIALGSQRTQLAGTGFSANPTPPLGSPGGGSGANGWGWDFVER